MKILTRIRKKWQALSKVQKVTVVSNQPLTVNDIEYVKETVKAGIDSNIDLITICVKLACSMEHLISPTLIRIEKIEKGQYEVSLLKE